MISVAATGPRQPLFVVERDVPEPGPGEGGLRIHACGVRHSGHFVVRGLWPGSSSLQDLGSAQVIGAIDLIFGDCLAQGWSSGTATGSTDALAFALAHGIKAMVESYALRDAQAAYDRMMSGQARFRVVLEMA